MPHAARPPPTNPWLAAFAAAESPAELLMDLLAELLAGQAPDLRQVVVLRSLLLRNADWYRPLGMGGQLLRNANLEVGGGRRAIDVCRWPLGAAAVVSFARFACVARAQPLVLSLMTIRPSLLALSKPRSLTWRKRSCGS